MALAVDRQSPEGHSAEASDPVRENGRQALAALHGVVLTQIDEHARELVRGSLVARGKTADQVG